MFELAHLKIPVSETGPAIKFYSALFGMEPVFVAEEYGWVQYMLGEMPLALYVPGKGGGDRTPGGSVDFHLKYQDLTQLPGRITDWPDADAAIHTNDDNSQSFECMDPDGNLLKILS